MWLALHAQLRDYGFVYSFLLIYKVFWRNSVLYTIII